MAAIYSVTNGVTPQNAQDVNQYAQALSNAFGITDTNPTNLGRLPLPIGTSDPVGPTNGQIWLRSDLGGADGRIYYRRNAKSIPHIGLRQRVVSVAGGAFNTASTAYVDFTNQTVAITTSGGRLKIYLEPDGAAAGAASHIEVGAGVAGIANVEADILCLVGAVSLNYQILQRFDLGIGAGITIGMRVGSGSCVWSYTPATGAYTVKLQVKVAAANEYFQASNVHLVVEEYDE